MPLVLHSKWSAKWVNGFTALIDPQVDNAGIVKVFNRGLDLFRRCGRIAYEHVAGRVRDDLDSIPSQEDRPRPCLEPPEADGRQRNDHRQGCHNRYNELPHLTPHLA